MLELEQLTVNYGQAVAVSGASLRVRPGEWVALIGPNGAGKSSLVRSAMGLQRYAGTVRIAGQGVDALPPWRRQALGIGYVPEGRRIFAKLHVEDNLRVGGYNLSAAALERGLARSFELFPRLAERRTQLAGTLSGGEQQMLAMARALMTEPKLLLVDEASLGLSPLVTTQVFEALRRVNEAGVAILLIEQNARLALRSVQRAYVLEVGRIALEGPATEVARSARVIESYVG